MINNPVIQSEAKRSRGIPLKLPVRYAAGSLDSARDDGVFESIS